MLEPHLVRLEAGDLIKQLIEPDLAYLFKHALVQDTARASLLLGERKRLHRAVAEALERLYPERRVELAPLLAQHFNAAGDDQKTLEYAMLAGDAAWRVNANAEALEYFTLALEVGERVQLPNQEMQQLYLKRGRTLELQGNFHSALSNYAELKAFGEKRQDPSMELASLMASATIYSIPSTAYDRTKSEELTGVALELARRLNDKSAQATILWNMMLVESRVGAGFSEALAHGEQALKIAQENNLIERLAYVKNDMVPLLAFNGEPDRAIRYNLESREMWVELENLPMLADNYGYSVMIRLWRGDYDIALADSREGLRISREINNQWNEAFNQAWIGEAYIERGDIAGAERVMLTAIEMGETVFPPTLVMTRSHLARLYADLGMPERGIELANQALEVASTRFKAIRATAVGALIEAYLAAGRVDDARDMALNSLGLTSYGYNPLAGIDVGLAQIKVRLATHEYALALESSDQLVSFLTDNQLFRYLPAVLMTGARAHLGLGNVEPAAADLHQALEVALDTAAQFSLWQVYAALSRLETGRANPELAATYRAQAQSIIESIAARTPKEYRDRFLERASRE